MSRISIAVAIFVSAAMLEMGGALVLGRVTHVLAQDTEDHDAPAIIKEERESEKKFLRTVAVDTLVLDEDRTTVATAGAAMALVATAAMGM